MNSLQRYKLFLNIVQKKGKNALLSHLIDGMSGCFYLEACLKVKEHRYDIRDGVSARAAGF